MMDALETRMWQIAAQTHIGHATTAVQEAQQLLVSLPPPSQLSDFFIASADVTDRVVMKSLWEKVEQRTHQALCVDLARVAMEEIELIRKALLESEFAPKTLKNFRLDMPAPLTEAKIKKIGIDLGRLIYLDKVIEFNESFVPNDNDASDDEGMTRVFDGSSAPPQALLKTLLDADVISTTAVISTTNVAIELLQALDGGHKPSAITAAFRVWADQFSQGQQEPFLACRVRRYLRAQPPAL